MEVVVVNEPDASAEFRVERTPEDLLEMVLAGFVCRVRLAGEHDLHGAARRGQDPREAIGVREDQLGPLVAGEAPGESDGERVLIEERRGGDDSRRAHVFVRPPRARPFADEIEEERPQRLAGGP